MKLKLILFFITLNTCVFSQETDAIYYHPDRKLRWEDFCGVSDFSDSNKAAQISTTIQLKSGKVNFWTGKAEFTGSAIMYKSKFWVKNGFRNDYVLSHEQIHFDIAYIAAKKLEIDINSIGVKFLNKNIVDAMYRNWHSIFLLNEQTYDLMTDGGNDVEMQRHYQIMINNQLKALERKIF
jgi:hypothetical protein